MSTASESIPQIKDYVSIRDCPTVVRFSDLSSDDNSWISHNYFLNDEIKAHFQAIKKSFSQNHGVGIFLIGSYGSGKSHFLAYLIQQLQQHLTPAPSRVVYLSLLDYASHESLESIIGSQLGIDTDEGSNTSISRSSQWRRLQHESSGGILLVMDELSEFLRSKLSPQAFTEDIRFLQFLGEWAQGEAFWLIAAMQEQIEHTGDLEYSLYRKIKDRFPLRLLLSTTHFADLLGNHLLIKTAAYASQVAQLAQRWQSLYPEHQQGLLQLQQFYPLHPATLTLMEEVRDGFSQTRGMVEFVLRQMGGDEAGRIQPFIERAWGELLSPDFIVDHFQDLFELQPEFLPLSQKLFPYYRENLSLLFPNAALFRLAERLIKLLVLIYLSPSRNTLSLEDACYWLLISVSQLQPQKNQQIIYKIFSVLAEQGRFIEKSKHGYRLNLQQDIGAQFDKQLERYLANVPQAQQVLLEEAVAGLPQNAFPLLQLENNRWQQRQLNWHFHPRQFWVCLGMPTAPAKTLVALCLRLPWDQADNPAGRLNLGFSLQPKPIAVTDELRKLVALQRMDAQPLTGAAAERVKAQLQSLGKNFITQLHNAYLQAVLHDKDGQRLQFNANNLQRIDHFLEQIALTLLKRTYPGFERFAPCHGPLPKSVYIDLMDYAADHDLLQEDAIDAVKLVCEAYWLPMGLIARQGKHYKVAPQLGNHALVKRLQPLLSHDPSPSLINEDLAEPILGLVEDQVSLLLLFLLLQGELEISRQQQSYRDLFETFPNPLQYDRVYLSHGLNPAESEQLQTLTKALEIRQPKQWTSLAQKQAINDLQNSLRKRINHLETCNRQLQQLAQDSPMTDGVDKVIKQWQPLLENEQPIAAWQQFIFEVHCLADFIKNDAEAIAIANFCQSFFNETKRYIYLLSRLKEPMNQDRIWGEDVLEKYTTLKTDHWQTSHQSWQKWLQDCRYFYDSYCHIYRQAHDEYWGAVDCEFMQWQPPALAQLEQLGLLEELSKLSRYQQQARQSICAHCSDLTYQPLCQCGFSHSILIAEIDETQVSYSGASQFVDLQTKCQQLIEKIKKGLKLYFGQKTVRKRLQQWQRSGLETTPELINYLEGEIDLPVIHDLKELNSWLAGMELIKYISITELQSRLLNRNWQLPELLNFLSDYLSSKQQSAQQNTSSSEQSWLRFTASQLFCNTGTLPWILKQCLQFGVKMPDFVHEHHSQQLWQKSYQAEWVSEQCLQNLQQLNFPAPLEDLIIAHLWDGTIGFNHNTKYPHPLIYLATRKLTQPTRLALEKLIELADCSYRQHQRMRKLLGLKWQQHIAALSKSSSTDKLCYLATQLNDILQQHPNAQFILIDALATFILPRLQPVIEQALTHWQLKQSYRAGLSDTTNTKNCYDLLQTQTALKRFEKINSIDDLIHQQCLPLEHLAEKAAVDIKYRLSQLLTKLDPKSPVIIFADHGFRLSADGQHYRHGGQSWLESTVPILSFLPKS